MARTPAIGIDFGTCYSSVAVFQHGKVEILTSGHGNRTTPSFVAFTESGRLVGDDAKSQMTANPLNTIFGSKRLIGRNFEYSSMQSTMNEWPFKLVNVYGKPKYQVEYKNTTRTFYYEEIVAMLLANLKETAEMHLREQVTDAVISIPVLFTNSQRQRILDAAAIAGLNVLRLIHETSAAAIAYTEQMHSKSENTRKQNILIFNLGGGSTDVSIANIDNNEIGIISTAGNSNLGGEDFDDRLVSHFANKFESKYEKTLTIKTRPLARLRAACEHAKRTLSTSEKASIELDNFYEGTDYYTCISRDQFEELNADLFHEIIEIVKKALGYAMMDPTQIDEVVLVGGSTRIPKIQQLLQNLFPGQTLCKTLNPDESVAYGAALHAAALQSSGKESNLPRFLGDITPFPLSISAQFGIIPLLKRNSIYPMTETQIFATLQDIQDSFAIKVYEGERALDDDRNLLGGFLVTQIPQVLRSTPVISVTFHVDANGIFSVKMLEITCAKMTDETAESVTKRVGVVNVKGGLYPTEIEEMTKTLFEFANEDKKCREQRKAMNELEGICFRMKRILESDKGRKYTRELDRKVALKKCNEVIGWLEDKRHVAGVHECLEKKKELEIAAGSRKKGNGTGLLLNVLRAFSNWI